MSRYQALHQAEQHDTSQNAKRKAAPKHSTPERKAAPQHNARLNAKQVPQFRSELRDPLLYSRYNNREAPLHALPSSCSLRQTEASTISPAVRHLGAQDYLSGKNALYISPGRFLFAAQESLALSTCGQSERFLLVYTLRGGPFQRFFAHGEPFLPKTALLWAISRKESFILSRGDQNERFFAVHERKRPLRPR